jgi:inorganic pyrophosphatase
MKPEILNIPSSDPKTGNLNAIIETPRGSRNKYAFDEKTGLFGLKKILPAGMAFPFDFGFIPSTLADDGDPLDVLIVTEEELFPGCLVQARLLGALKCKQGAKGRLERNDRLIAVPILEDVPVKIRSLNELDDRMLCELEKFFVFQHKLVGEEFKVLETIGPRKAWKLVKRAQLSRSKRK